MAQSLFSSIEQTLLNQFQQGPELVRIFREHEIESFLHRTFSKLKGYQPGDPAFSLESYTSLILHELNQRIIRIDNQGERMMVKSALAELFQAFILQFVTPFPHQAQKFVQAVKTTCEFHNYDFEDARQFLRLYDLEITFMNVPKAEPKKESRYSWISTSFSFEKFIAEIVYHKLVYSKKELRSIFEQETKRRSLRANPTKKLELAIVFDLLYTNEIITVKGQNGKFIPLVQYTRGNEEEILYKVDPSRMIERAKRKPLEFFEKEKKIMIWLRPLIMKDCGKVMVKGLLPPTEAENLKHL